MDNIIIMPYTESYSHKAKEKIAAELKEFKGDRYAEAVKNHVAATLTHFCGQDERFAEVVYKTKRTLSDCCAEIMKGCGQSISDIDVYRGAVRNYFPNADIDFHMTITLTGDAPTVEEMERVPEKKPEKKVEKKAEDKKPTKAEKTTKVKTEPPKPPAEKPQPKAAAPAPAPTPEAPKPAAPAKKNRKAETQYDDPDIIQLSLF